MMIPSRAVTPPDASATQLLYSIQVNPDPLTALPTVASGDQAPAPQFASLVLMATNPNPPGTSVDVGSLNLLIPSAYVTTGAASLTSELPGSDVVISGNWSVTNEQTPFTTNSSNPGYLILGLTGNQSVSGGSTVTVQIDDIEVDSYSGNLLFQVQETISGAPPGQYNTADITIPKLPAGFYFDFLVVTSGGDAVAQVPYNTQVTLTWGSSIAQLSEETSYTVYYSTQQGQQSVALDSQVSTWTSPALTCDTEFTVVANVNLSDAAQTVAQYALSASVAVQQPDLVVDSLTLTQASGGSAAGLTVNTSTSMIGAPQPVPLPPWDGPSATYTATTDGMLVCAMTNRSTPCWSFLTAQYTTASGTTISVTCAGGMTAPAAALPIYNLLPSSFTLPVPNGTTVTMSFSGGNTWGAITTLFFIPFGAGTMTQNQ
jgi:hypothetical protein